MISELEFVTKLQALFREELEQPDLQISMDTSQQDLGNWDSLAHVRIVIAVERAYNIQLDVAEIESIDSVRAFYEAASRHSK